MGLTLAGIDEAGYGPTLGPFCVGLAVFHLPGREEACDLWSLLKKGVCKSPGRGAAHDRRGRVAVNDSKLLKLPNDAPKHHPLIHLERGVLAFARLLSSPVHAPCEEQALFEALGVGAEMPEWYAPPRGPLPVALTAGEVAIAAAVLEGAAAKANVRVRDVRVDVTWEREFNRTVGERRNKADAALAAVCRHVRRVWEGHGAKAESGEPEHLLITCDRLGGRVCYAEVLRHMLPGASVEVLEESQRRSRYALREEGGAGRRAEVHFLVEGESEHLPIALASMLAKYVRELSMARFNAYFGHRHRDLRGVELRPTAGYNSDARRWLRDAGDILSPRERAELVRIL